MNKKSIFRTFISAVCLTLVMSFGGSMISAKTAADFTDLIDLDAATKAKIDALLSAGVFNGVSESSFGLSEDMNRAQFAKVSALIFNLNVDTDIKQSSFTDVKIDTPGFGYALPYIEAVRAAGITEGVGGDRFDPEGNVTKEQLATFLVRGLGLETQATLAKGVDDETVSDWAKGYVDLALSLNLLSNTTEDTFGGNIPADREQLVVGAFQSAKKFEESKPLHTSGADFKSGDILHLAMTAKIDPKSIDLSKFKINGKPLDPELDSFELSEDMMTIIIKLHNALPFDPYDMPLIDISDHIITLFGNSVENEEGKSIPITVSESTVPTTSDPNSGPNQPITSDPNSGPNQPITSDPNSGPNQPINSDPNSGPNQPINSDPNSGPNQPITSDPNSGPNQPINSDPNQNSDI